jgi:hypothetical protein
VCSTLYIHAHTPDVTSSSAHLEMTTFALLSWRIRKIYRRMAPLCPWALGRVLGSTLQQLQHAIKVGSMHVCVYVYVHACMRTLRMCILLQPWTNSDSVICDDLMNLHVRICFCIQVNYAANICICIHTIYIYIYIYETEFYTHDRHQHIRVYYFLKTCAIFNDLA